MTGNKLIDNILLGLCCALTLGALGTYIYTDIIYKAPIVVNKDEIKELLADGMSSTKYISFKVDKLTINIISTRTKMRYLNVITHLVLYKEHHIELLEQKKPLIQDAIIGISTKMTPNELNTISGKLLLESRIKKVVNIIMGKQIVKDVLFSEFVVQ